jgi:hypothetical protein
VHDSKDHRAALCEGEEGLVEAVHEIHRAGGWGSARGGVEAEVEIKGYPGLCGEFLERVEAVGVEGGLTLAACAE